MLTLTTVESGHAQKCEEPTTNMLLRRLMDAVKASGKPRLVALDAAAEVYRTHGMQSIQMSYIYIEKAALAIPIPEGRFRGEIVMTSLEPPSVAFRQNDLALLAAIADLLCQPDS